MDIQAMQSMDWLFKKERIYLLAQFWQQVSSPVALSGTLKLSPAPTSVDSHFVYSILLRHRIIKVLSEG
jgi:hypothetical protein